MLQASSMNAYYGTAHVLSSLSLKVEKGEVVCLLGRNGAGKSTTLKALMGLVPPRDGQVSFCGDDITGMRPFRIASRGLGYVPEERRIFTNLTVEENLLLGVQPKRDGFPFWTPERLYELFPNLGRMKTRLGGRMSGGEQQMLAIARTLMGNPKLILLDEPTEGIAPVVVEQMAKTIAELKREGLSILLSEQNFHFASYLGDRVYILEKGEVVYAGSMQQLKASPEIRAQFLAL
jgi:branched-chain amino acid transport system ATP-binding protein